METHRLLQQKLFELHKIESTNYCYDTQGERKCIDIEMTEDEYNEMVGTDKIITDAFVFNKRLRIVERDEVDETVYVRFFYKIKDNADFSANLFTGEKLYGVICPEGKFYQCAYEGHRYLEPWLEKRDIIQSSPQYSSDPFEWWGWVKLTGAYMTTCEFIHEERVTKYDFKTSTDNLLKENRITEPQVKAIEKYIKGLGRELVNFNYHWYQIDDFTEILDRDIEDNVFDFAIKYGDREIENEREELDKENPKDTKE